jgi:hypothetical protein
MRGVQNTRARAGSRANGLDFETEHDFIVEFSIWFIAPSPYSLPTQPRVRSNPHLSENRAKRVAFYNEIDLSETLNAWIKTVLLEAVVGLSIGGIIGMFAAIARKRDLKSAWLDVLLGAIGFAGGTTGAALMPWNRTVTTKNVGGMIISTTTMHYPHPYRVGFLAAIGLVMICELIRGVRARRVAQSKDVS